MLRRSGPISALLAALAGLCAACGTMEAVREVVEPPAPKLRYAQALEAAGLASTAAGKAWFAAGRAALLAPEVVAAPLEEAVFLSPAEPRAVAYRFALRRGQRLEVNVAPPQGAEGQLFLDLYLGRQLDPWVAAVTAPPPEGTPEVPSPRPPAEPKPLLGAAAGAPLTFEVPEDGDYVLRLQPELLTGGRYRLRLAVAAGLTFPVEGKDDRAIKSFFGAPRDGGRRRHHGVDIFAPKGTTVRAVSDGLVIWVGENGLGGKVVWQRDAHRRQTYYYAHLDEQLVAAGDRLQAGEPVGFVGNTGNARTTPPHLHFGIYRSGPIDPLGFLSAPGQPAKPVTADVDRLGAWSRIATRRANVRSGPSTRAAAQAQLDEGTALLVEAGREGWYRVRLPDGQRGWVAPEVLEPARAPLCELAVSSRRVLRRWPEPRAQAVGLTEAEATLGVLGTFGAHLLVDSPEGPGWLEVECGEDDCV